MVNKRAIYYTLLDDIKSTSELDDLICDACFLLNLSRTNIGIQASAKGLMSGRLSLEQDIDCMQIPSKYVQQWHPDLNDVQCVLVVEKDTVFQRLIQMPIVINSKNLLVVTAKGYPDFATRKFLSLLANAGKQLFYIGDADPFGAEIFFTYCFGSLKFAICEQL